MRISSQILNVACVATLTILAYITEAAAQATTPSPVATSPSARRDGQHDFDFEIGSWKTHLKRLLHPLAGSTTWAEYDGVTTVRRVWNGRANLVELEVDGPKGHSEALSLRLYDPEWHH